MSGRVCLCVGVSNHLDPRISTLNGACVDAKKMFAALTHPEKGEYDVDASKLLIDPTQEGIVSALADLTYDKDLETLTFFFAGHGGQGAGGYCLCCHDTDLNRFVVSALPIARIFQLLSETKPRHVNLIIDACQAAGMVGDLGNLLKPSNIGPASTFSVSVFALSASDKYAGEDDEGGFGTTRLLKCINGETDCLVRKEFLSLDDIGSVVGPALKDQSPSIWSFNLSGTSRFVRNPFSSASASVATVPVPSFSTSSLETLQPTKLDALWQIYLDLPDELDPRTLQNELVSVLQKLDSDEQKAETLIGLSESFSARADRSDDAFNEVLTQCAFLFAAQKIGEVTVREAVCHYFIDQIDGRLEKAFLEINGMLDTSFSLLSRGGAYSEFFCLPIRISKVLSWSLVSVLLGELFGKDTSQRVSVARGVFEKVFDQYQLSLNVTSEEQAPFALAISELGKRFGLSDLSESYISHLYFDFFFAGHKVAKTKILDSDIFDYLEYRCSSNDLDYRRFSAKPTELMCVLLHHFVSSDQIDIVRYDFQDLDHTHVNTFVPDNYRNFSDDMIMDGENIGFTIGFDVFTIDEFKSFFSDYILPNVDSASRDLSPSDQAASLLASLVYPDRIPWFLTLTQRKSV